VSKTVTSNLHWWHWFCDRDTGKQDTLHRYTGKETSKTIRT